MPCMDCLLAGSRWVGAPVDRHHDTRLIIPLPEHGAHATVVCRPRTRIGTAGLQTEERCQSIAHLHACAVTMNSQRNVGMHQAIGVITSARRQNDVCDNHFQRIRERGR